MVNKKGNLGLILAIVVLSLVILSYILIAVAQRECSSNKDCSDNAYCSTEYKCHEYPSQVQVNNNYFGTALVFGLLLIVAAFVYKNGRLPYSNKLKKIKRKKKTVETEEGYIEW